jgi:gluconokinase
MNIGLSDDEIGEEISRRGADAHGLTVMPFFFGERSTGYNENARGSIFGLTASHDSIDILQAAMEAIAFRFAKILDQLNEVTAIDEIVVSGGALDGSPVWTQIIADVLGRDLLVSSQPEASLHGAVLLALESLGKIEQLEKREPKLEHREFHPKCHEIYKNARDRHEKFYDALVDWV